MLLNSVILVLREVLEAAMVVSMFMAFFTVTNLRHSFLLRAILIGLFAGSIYAFNLPNFSLWFDGVGQEIVNTALHAGIFICLFAFAFLNSCNTTPQSGLLRIFVGLAIVMAISRESAEIMLYISGFSGMQSVLTSVVTGSLIGLGLGMSVGVFLYYLMISLSGPYTRWLIHVLVVMVAGSMMAQASQFLIQADWLPSSSPLWDSSGLISEHSLSGQLLYALMGYEATPSALQVIIYALSLILMLLAIASGCYLKKSAYEN
ncbi:MAG: FTR1 family protein [Methylophaga sp.]|nr:FTR1 family protein [Methylophaga sp.]